MTAPLDPATIPKLNGEDDELYRAIYGRVEAEAADDLWVPAAVFAIVLLGGGLAFWLGGLFS